MALGETVSGSRYFRLERVRVFSSSSLTKRYWTLAACVRCLCSLLVVCVSLAVYVLTEGGAHPRTSEPLGERFKCR